MDMHDIFALLLRKSFRVTIKMGFIDHLNSSAKWICRTFIVIIKMGFIDHLNSSAKWIYKTFLVTIKMDLLVILIVAQN